MSEGQPAGSQGTPQAQPLPGVTPAPGKGGGKRAAKKTPTAQVTLPPYFKLVFVINAIVCGSCFFAMLWLAAVATKDAPEQTRSAYATVEAVFKMTAGAFLGLLAGKAASPTKVKTR